MTTLNRTGKMPTTALERLAGLKHDLAGLSAIPWSLVESWIAKATPVIRQDWPEHFGDFCEYAKRPRMQVTMGVIRAQKSQLEKEMMPENSRRFISARDNLLSFLD